MYFINLTVVFKNYLQNVLMKLEIVNVGKHERAH